MKFFEFEVGNIYEDEVGWKYRLNSGEIIEVLLANGEWTTCSTPHMKLYEKDFHVATSKNEIKFNELRAGITVGEDETWVVTNDNSFYRFCMDEQVELFLEFDHMRDSIVITMDELNEIVEYANKLQELHERVCK